MNIQEQLRSYESAIIAAPRRVLAAPVDWKKDITRDAGVYVIWKGKFPVYVGETSALRSRMADLTVFEHHSFARRTRHLFGLAANDRKGLISAYSNNYELSFCAIPFGRKEVEEYLILRWRSTLSNKVTARLLSGHQYRWVETAQPTQFTDAEGISDTQGMQGNQVKEHDLEVVE